MKKTYLGLMGLFLLPQTALAVDAAAPASTSVSSPLAALWRVLLTPITVPHLPWQLPLLAPVALVLVLLLLILWQLHRCLGVRLHLLRGLFPPAAAAACCTGAAWLCHTYAQPLGMLLSAAAASGVGCLVYLTVWGLLMGCRKRKALI